MPEFMLAGNRVELLHDGDACMAALRAAIEAARQEILLEMYWFGSDETGRGFARLLGDKARTGVRVCVTYDAVGSFEADRGMFAEMRDAGCGVYEYNPVSVLRGLFSFPGVNRRNHRKQLIVDGKLGFTGGLNLADQWTSKPASGTAFRDDMIALQGPAARVMRDIFLGTYRGPYRAEAARAAFEPIEPAGDSRVRVLANDRRKDRRLIERSYLARIRSARGQIMISNSYFVPNRRVRYALFQAVRRGVRVRVLLPRESDVPAVMYATRRLYELMLSGGIELYEWGRSVLHSKIAVIDDSCTVGTHNLDHRSLAYNLEINVVVEDERVAAQLERRMQSDFEESVRVDAHFWRFRPLGQRLLELFFYALRKLL